ncbi:MAG: hypothetical protein JWN45_1615 [Acidobacteriaceae bacterium]|nr:hypothetical protein [Acidobacteriaceae bacterium]
MIRKYTLAFVIFAATLFFVALGVAFGGRLRVAFMSSGDVPGSTGPANTPNLAAQHLLENVQRRNVDAAYSYVGNTQDVSLDAFSREVSGSDGNLKSLAALNEFQIRALKFGGEEATVRADLQWSTAVGAFYETRDFNAVKSKSGWKVIWPIQQEAKLAPQVIPVTYPRWDMVGSNANAANDELPAPRVRVLSQNVGQDADTFVVVGELANEDSVPAFVSVNATIVGADGNTLGQENSFDNIVHVLLPNQHTPFRIDFPATSREQVKNIRLSVNSKVIAASGDPAVSVTNPRVESVGESNKVLRGEIVNQTGSVVNIPQVLATYYDGSGKVIWVNTTYLDRALLPQNPLAFTMKIPDEIAKQVKNYKVAVNSYQVDKS